MVVFGLISVASRKFYKGGTKLIACSQVARNPHGIAGPGLSTR